jgi:aspartate aminotransferase
MLELHLTPKVKLIVLNSPSNPTGAVIPPNEIRKIAALIEKRELYCVSDEIYSKLIFGDAEHLSIAACSDYAREHTIVVNGCSKAYSMTGWRIGYAAGDAAIIKAMSNIQSQSTSNPCAIAQAAAVTALAGDQKCVDEMRQKFRARRDLIVNLLNDIAGISCHMPGGAFYVLPDISAVFGQTIRGKTINSPTDFCHAALDPFAVACVPGEAFGSDKHIRLSYATSEAQIEKGCARLKEMIEGK